MTKIIRESGIAVTGMFIALAWGSAPAMAQTVNAADNWEAMTKCAAIADADARHDCSDEVLRKAGLLKESTEPKVSKATEPEPKPTASAVAKPAAQAEPSPAQSAAIKPSDSREDFGLEGPKPKSDKDNRIEVTLERAVKAGDGKLVLITTDGAVWRQLYSNSLLPTPSAGEVMKVRKNSLGGYLCRVGKKPSFKCERTS